MPSSMEDYNLLFGLGSYTIVFVFSVYYCILADPSKSKLAYLLTVRLPHFLKTKIFQSIFGERITSWLITTIINRLLAIFYIVIILGSWSIIFMFTYPWIDEAAASTGLLSPHHKIGGYVVFVACLASWSMASHTSPGIITADTIHVFESVYPYDGLLFVRGRRCPTVGIPKVARSKYDRISEQHIAKFDHFCGWLHNPIGDQNYRWFLLFLVIHVVMCMYGTYVVGWLLFVYEIDAHDLWNHMFFHRKTGAAYPATTTIVLQYLFQRLPLQSGVFVLLSVMSVVLLLFLGWHCWIASRGMTTNEYVKWKQVHKWYNGELHRYHNRTADETMPVQHKDNDDDTTDEHDTQQVYHPGPKPKNIYNTGFMENWNDIFFPRSLQKEANHHETTTHKPKES